MLKMPSYVETISMEGSSSTQNSVLCSLEKGCGQIMSVKKDTLLKSSYFVFMSTCRLTERLAYKRGEERERERERVKPNEYE